VVEGSVIIEPAKNGWIVLLFREEEPEEELQQQQPDEDEDEAGYDPSAAFAAEQRAQRPQARQSTQTILHMHMQEQNCPCPQKFVFASTQHVEMLEFLAAHTKN
jgi:hypothetical protein